MTQEQYTQALSRQLDIIANFQRCLTFERQSGTNLGVRQYEHLLKKLFAELAELMAEAPSNIKHEVIAHQE